MIKYLYHRMKILKTMLAMMTLMFISTMAPAPVNSLANILETGSEAFLFLALCPQRSASSDLTTVLALKVDVFPRGAGRGSVIEAISPPLSDR